MRYVSTRGGAPAVTGAQAILQGIAPDGGLYVPDTLEPMDFRALMGRAYPEVAEAVLRTFLPDYDEAFLREALAASYGANFGGKAGHLAPVGTNLYSLELWHGPTAAFKDYALQCMPKLLVEARRMMGVAEETLVLVATSGDTGKAALEGFKDLEGIQIAVFYPSKGTSEIQRLQMVTQEGGNVAVYAIHGNFDDAQRGVKAAFLDGELAAALAKQGKKLSSANSINWGRLLPQLVYYVTTYLALCEQGALEYGQPLDYCVPTGNFGDIMAGWYARKLGLPVGRLVCASNKNNVLADFLGSGVYNARRPFHKTSSPSMDILVSSNLERLLYHESSGNAAAVKGWMEELNAQGHYQVDEATLTGIRQVFAAGWADEDAVGEEIRRRFEEQGYLADPHTAVAFRVVRSLYGDVPSQPVVVLSTASPFKFSEKVLCALDIPVPEDEFDALRALADATGQTPLASLNSLACKAVRFTQEIDAGEIKTEVLSL